MGRTSRSSPPWTGAPLLAVGLVALLILVRAVVVERGSSGGRWGWVERWWLGRGSDGGGWGVGRMVVGVERAGGWAR